MERKQHAGNGLILTPQQPVHDGLDALISRHIISTHFGPLRLVAARA
jgi:hypothetical protein